MAHRLTELDKHFEFHICSSKASFIPFEYELQNWTFAPNIEIHLDHYSKSTMDVAKVLATPDENSLVYVCGPEGFNRWIRETGLQLGWASSQIKEEVFSRSVTEQTETKAFDIFLQKSGKKITVEKDMTIIDALLLNNIKVDYTCLQGTCGTCISSVIEGNIDHRDAILTEEEKAAQNKMCLCVSRAKEGNITFDM